MKKLVSNKNEFKGTKQQPIVVNRVNITNDVTTAVTYKKNVQWKNTLQLVEAKVFTNTEATINISKAEKCWLIHNKPIPQSEWKKAAAAKIAAA